MTFFLNNQPPSPEREGEEKPASHSPKSAPLFKQESTSSDPLGGKPLSLSAYISQHLDTQKAETPTIKPGNVFNPAKAPKQPVGHATVGQFLNNLDVELASGLEQYLPTPVFRLRVMKKRLDGEIAELRSLLNKYNRLPNPSPDMKERTSAVRHRLRVLEHHEARVSWQLAESLPMGMLFYRLSSVFAGSGHTVSNLLGRIWHGLARLVYGRSYVDMETAGIELMELETVFRRRMDDRTIASNELGQLLHRYEQTLSHAEKKARNLSEHSFIHRVWQEALGLLK